MPSCKSPPARHRRHLFLPHRDDAKVVSARACDRGSEGKSDNGLNFRSDDNAGTGHQQAGSGSYCLHNLRSRITCWRLKLAPGNQPQEMNWAPARRKCGSSRLHDLRFRITCRRLKLAPGKQPKGEELSTSAQLARELSSSSRFEVLNDMLTPLVGTWKTATTEEFSTSGRELHIVFTIWDPKSHADTSN
jgi:hypothetical protein